MSVSVDKTGHHNFAVGVYATARSVLCGELRRSPDINDSIASYRNRAVFNDSRSAVHGHHGSAGDDDIHSIDKARVRTDDVE